MAHSGIESSGRVSQFQREGGLMSEEVGHQVEVDVVEPPASADLVGLIWEAFEQARSSGRSDWNVMTVAVLKNRLLDITQRQFKESDYSARSMSDLVRKMSDMLELDESTRPPKVILREDKTGARLSHGAERVRPDLWNAIVDYTGERRYVWTLQGRAVAVDPDESRQEPVLPTLSREEEAGLRADFVARMAPADEAEGERLEAWRDRTQSPRVLPGPLQRAWNEELKTFVVDRLKAWFAKQGVAAPSDLLVPLRQTVRQTKANDDVEALRALVIRCVQRMTADELSELRLPVQALLRGQR